MASSIDEPLQHLARNDRRLAGVISRLEGFDPAWNHNSRERDGFTTLARAIIGQQLSAAAAKTIHSRLCAGAPGKKLSPEWVLEQSDEAIQTAGLSAAKARFLKNLACAVSDGSVDFESLNQSSDEDVIAALTAISGIGKWTAEMYVIFGLGRDDVFPASDAGILRAMSLLDSREKPYSSGQAHTRAKSWRPYRSIACRVLWKAMDSHLL